MTSWKRRLVTTSLVLLGIIPIYFVLTFLYMDFAADRWWFSSLGYGTYFWQRQLYRYLVFVLVAGIFFGFFFLNFWIAGRFLRGLQAHHVPANMSAPKSHHKIFTMIYGGSSRIFTPLSAVLAVITALPLFQHWQDTLLYFAAPSAGITDPVFSKDISFYLFSFPIYKLMQSRLLIASLCLLITITLLYFLSWKRANRNSAISLPVPVRIHLSLLTAAAFSLEIWDLLLQRYELLYRHDNPLFFGPTYVEMKINLPLIWLTLFVFGALGIATLYYLNKEKGGKVVLALAVSLLMCFGLQKTTFLQNTVRSYIVKPNEISREKRYIQNSIRATLAAYKLNNIETREYALTKTASLINEPTVRDIIRNIPVWDGELLLDVFKQLQEIRPYYDFVDVDVGRYRVQGLYHQVYLGAREINLEELPDSAKNWINQHLKYTHGQGAVMTPAAQDGEEPISWFLRDIPPRSDFGIHLGQTAIYYGLENYDYVIAPSEIGEMDFSASGEETLTHYTGRGGVPLGSVFKKLFYSLYFRDSNILFTTRTNARSRILYRRNIIERVKTITPFFTLDNDPYLVITTKGLYWILQGYTTSDWYPNAEPCDRGFNYIRDAVKIVVDAYSGTVTYFVSDESDPIIRAYRRIYPSLFRNSKEIPKELKKHLRYPRDLFEIQMQIYAKYHQQDPERFYNQEDTWQLARVYQGDQALIMHPYYVTLNLFDLNRQEFLLISPMSPKGLDTLRSLALAGCDGKRYGKITIFRFPKGTQVFGPSQINALIDQDTTISQEFTLWNQVGSAVDRGRITILPVQGTILYIQPVYLKSSARLKIPELKRLIVSQGEYVVMDRTLEKAFTRLEERIERRAAHLRRKMEMPATVTKPQPPSPSTE